MKRIRDLSLSSCPTKKPFESPGRVCIWNTLLWPHSVIRNCITERFITLLRQTWERTNQWMHESAMNWMKRSLPCVALADFSDKPTGLRRPGRVRPSAWVTQGFFTDIFFSSRNLVTPVPSVIVALVIGADVTDYPVWLSLWRTQQESRNDCL